MKQETILQSLKRIEDVIYTEPYDELSDYLKGVRDVINLLNGEEPNDSVADFILETFKQEFTPNKSIITVQDLINELQQVENKSKPVFVYDENSNLYDLSVVDREISDRVDINIVSKPD